VRRFGPLLLLALIAGTVVLAGSAQAGAACFWIHGRLSAANGSPTFRLWRIGARRILGVRDGEDESAAMLPAPVRALVTPDAFQVDVFGDFQVCPQTPERPGRMRMVRIAGARRLIARPSTAPRGAD